MQCSGSTLHVLKLTVMPATMPNSPIDLDITEGILNTMDAALEASAQQNELYRPSSFWAQASQDIVTLVKDAGLDRFRSVIGLLGYFVPTYGPPGNRLTAEMVEQIRNCSSDHPMVKAAIEQFVSGYATAEADYRVLMAADDQSKRPYLHNISESDVGSPIEQFGFDGCMYSRSSLNYKLGLCLLKRHLGDESISTVVEIGGGFGALGEILLKGGDTNIKYIDFDIPPNSAITQYYLSKIFGAEHVLGYDENGGADPILIDQLPAASALCNWQIEQLEGQVDLFVNFISFQEMEPSIVANYLSHVDRLQARWVLLRNLREGKQVKTATSIGVKEPILGDHYRQMLPAYDLVESNVLPFGYRTVDGFHSELMLFKRRN